VEAEATVEDFANEFVFGENAAGFYDGTYRPTARADGTVIKQPPP